MYWHELTQNQYYWLFPAPAKDKARVTVCFRGQDVRKTPFAGYFMRYEGAGDVPQRSFSPWEKEPDGWFELWPKDPMLATSAEGAKTLFQPILSQVEDGSLDASFEKKPYLSPAKPLFIEDIGHPIHLANARIVQHANGLYQVTYTVYAANGRYFPSSTPSISSDPDYEWGVAIIKDADRNQVDTMADDLLSAREIAEAELSLVVTRDPEIQRRPSFTSASDSENQT